MPKWEHYCQGAWVEGKRVDCPEPEHNVKLQKEVKT